MQLKFPDETKADDEWAYQKLATWPNCQPHPQALERVGKLINTVKEGNVSFLPKKVNAKNHGMAQWWEKGMKLRSSGI